MSRSRLKFQRTTLISIVLVDFLIGLALSRTKIYISIWWVVVCFAIFMVTALMQQRLLVPALVAFGLSAGWYYKKHVTLVGTADSDAVYGANTQLVFDLAHVHVVAPGKTDLVGKIGVKGFGAPMVYKGDRVSASAKLYPTRGSKQAGLSFAEITVITPSKSFIESTRRRFNAGMQSALPEPVASFGLGLLIGQRSTLPQQVSLQLSAVGLTHVVAVSGYNLTIIMRGVKRFLKKCSKYQSTLVSLLLIGVFLLFTGFSASIVRAALVSMLSLWAWYYGRSFRPIVLLLVAAVITAGLYPIYLWSDIGWYLSFLAFYGVMVIGPQVTQRIYKRKEPKLLMALIIETSCAQIMTMPIIMYIFGQFSVIALVANILVVPLVPIGMLLCLVAGLGGMLLTPVAGWFALPARLVLTYMLDIVAALSHLPKALIKQPLGLWQMITLYGLILFTVTILWHKNRGKRGIIVTELAGGLHVGSQQMVNNQTGKGYN
jgi:ComEC/Rec2-related protein